MSEPTAKERLLQPLEERGVTTPGQQVGPVRQPEVSGPTVIEGQYSEVKPEGKGRSFLGRLVDSLADPKQWAVLGAEWNRGLKDLQNVVLDPWAGQAATHEEPGTIANPTQIEVYQAKHMDAAEPTGHGLPPQARADPVDRARSNALEAAQEKGKSQSFEIG